MPAATPPGAAAGRSFATACGGAAVGSRAAWAAGFAAAGFGAAEGGLATFPAAGVFDAALPPRAFRLAGRLPAAGRRAPAFFRRVAGLRAATFRRGAGLRAALRAAFRRGVFLRAACLPAPALRRLFRGRPAFFRFALLAFLRAAIGQPSLACAPDSKGRRKGRSTAPH
jgi:hypothetical protein